ncbi:MAG: sigma-70 family RNA polymerase sigma factor [Acidobacteria bacterium]|nr:MAG: sigma-70 family RNA polymerase sigma factor [Acidobacteriota bacterium]
MNAEVSDDQLLRGCLEGDPKSLELLVRVNMRLILSVAHRYTSNVDEAEDLCQEIFEKVLRNLRTFRGESQLKTWVYSIAVTHCMNFRTRRVVAVADIEDPNVADLRSTECPADRQLLQRETAQAVHQAVNSLPEKLKQVVLLAEFEGVPHRQIAAKLGVPEGTVWSRLSKARGMLRQKLLACV